MARGSGWDQHSIPAGHTFWLQQPRRVGLSYTVLTVSRHQVLDLVQLLDPFYEATQALQGDGITSSLVMPAVMGIDHVMRSYNSQFGDFMSLMKQLRRAFQQISNHRQQT